MRKKKDPHTINPLKRLEQLKDKREHREYQKNYNYDEFEEQQRRMFEKLTLDYDAGKKWLEQIHATCPHLVDQSASQHHTLFAALSLTHSFNDILEIGTYDGRNAALLSKLFPSARIETMDLPDDHPVFVTTYRRDLMEFREAFIRNRNATLAEGANVQYLAVDSVSLTFETNKTYDLIWVDGTHGYPVVAIDIANAVRLVNKTGFVTCDDVWTERKESDPMYHSVASYQSLQALRDAGLIRFELIFKRLTAKRNANPKRRRFIGVVTKI